MSERGSRGHGEELTSITVTYNGQAYERDVVKCQQAFLERAIEGRFKSKEELASKLGLSARTVERFFSGAEPCSEATVRRILAEVDLSFDEVHTRVIANG